MDTVAIIYIISQILSYTGNILFTSSALFKKKSTIITLQSSNHLLSSIAQWMGSAYSGMVQDIVALIRNITLLFIKDNQKILKIIISILCMLVASIVGIVLNILLNDNVWYGYLPVIATILYSTAVIIVFVKNVSNENSELILKIALIFNSICWATYGINIRFYAITIFNSLTFTLSIISIIMIIKNKRKNSLN